MRFETKDERDSLIVGFKQKALELTKIKKEDPKTDPSYNPVVIFDTRTEYDEDSEIEFTNDGIKYIGDKCSGDIYVFYFKQPNLLESIKIIESGEKDKIYGRCLMAWDNMIDKVNSSPEVFYDRIKLGYLPRMINHIQALLFDQKKR